MFIYFPTRVFFAGIEERGDVCFFRRGFDFGVEGHSMRESFVSFPLRGLFQPLGNILPSHDVKWFVMNAQTTF